MKIYIKIIIAALAAGVAAILYFRFAAEPVKAVTDRSSYKVGGILEVAIKNDFDKPICFSSCYPYFIELQKSGDWAEYAYPECLHGKPLSCVAPGVERKFQLALDEGEIGMNRLKIPVCVDCQDQIIFMPDFTFYSNNFDIQK